MYNKENIYIFSGSIVFLEKYILKNSNMKSNYKIKTTHKK